MKLALGKEASRLRPPTAPQVSQGRAGQRADTHPLEHLFGVELGFVTRKERREISAALKSVEAEKPKQSR